MDKVIYEKMLSYAFRILARKRYTTSEMMKKLDGYREGKNLDGVGGEKQHVISRLTELKYLDDEQFAKDFVDMRSRNKPAGKMLLVRDLARRGIKKDLVEAAIGESEYDELEAAADALGRKMSGIIKSGGGGRNSGDRSEGRSEDRSKDRSGGRSGDDESDDSGDLLFDRSKIDERKVKEKAFRFLASRGFKPDTIYKTVERWYNRSEEWDRKDSAS